MSLKDKITKIKENGFLAFFPPPLFFNKNAGSNYSLPMKGFSGPTSYTWDDYYKDLEKHYPFKYKFLKSVEDACYKAARIYRKYIKDPLYWLKCHILPKYKYHMLDLRQPEIKGYKDLDLEYKYGWIDVDQRMTFAIFNLLNEFVEKEIEQFYCPEDHNNKQHQMYIEIIYVYHWWNVIRIQNLILEKEKFEEYNKSNISNYQSKETQRLFDEWSKIDLENKQTTQKMLIKIMQLKDYLWT